MSTLKSVLFLRCQSVLTVFWLGSQLLHRVHAVDLDALWKSCCADALLVYTDDLLQIGDLRKNTLYGYKNVKKTIMETEHLMKNINISSGEVSKASWHWMSIC